MTILDWKPDKTDKKSFPTSVFKWEFLSVLRLFLIIAYMYLSIN